MNEPKNFAVLHENQTTSYQISGVAGTNTTVLEEEEDPSVANLSDYIDEDAVQSDIYINIEGGGRSPICFSPISTNSNGASNQFNSITHSQQSCRANSTIQSQLSGNQASTQTRSAISIESSGALSKFLEAAMVQSEGENNTDAGGAKTDKDNQDGQDYKKQRSAEPYSMSRGENDDPAHDRTRDCVRATRYRGRTIEHAT